MNEKIKSEIKRRHLYQYQVAAEVGVSEFTLLRWLRMPLTKEREDKLLSAINALSERAYADE